MSDTNVYLKCERNVGVQTQDVFLKDLGSLRCQDKQISAKLRSMKVHHFRKEGPARCVLDGITLIGQMEDTCPGISVQLLGEPDVLVQWIPVSSKKDWRVWLKAAMVCFISFFGTAFTIMAYHNDVGINEIFTEIYRIVMNQEPQGMNVLEVSYSLGLAAGIITFFNHVGGRRLTKDPTPIEVAMRKYEEDVDKTLVETASREGKEE